MSEKAQRHSFILSVDRIEGDWAVLVTDDGLTFDMPRTLLPEKAAEGSHVQCSMAIETHHTSSLKEAIRTQMEELSEGDDGGDIIL